jgi:lysophospholipid acyltransferase (LPLAT)-like uncharacterized protein
MKEVWVARVGAVIVRLLGWTWRVRFVNPEVRDEFEKRREPFIYVLWHGQLLPLLWTHRHRQVSVMISEHRDGELIARVAHSLGFRTVRGSTSRGAARALLSASREVDAGYCLAITVDGPRGPSRVVAPGAPIIAQRTSAPMLPTAAAATRAWRLKSWDRFMIPKPFARVTVAYGAAMRVAADSARDAAEQVDLVRDAIDDATTVAASAIGA